MRKVESLRAYMPLSLSELGLFLRVLLLCAQVTHGDNCTVKPLVLPITNVTFRDGVAVNRGVRLVLGGDQIQGLRISTILNNTRVRNVLDCPSTNLNLCQGQSGSMYSTTTGSFKPVYNLKDWNVSFIDYRPTDGTTVIQGYDSANFTDAPVSIPNFPLEVWSNDKAPNRSALALGPKSSVIERLVSGNSVPSSILGIDYGSRSEAQPRDGQIIIGGHNAARHKADETRGRFSMWGFAAPVNCPLQVLLADVILTQESGNHSLMVDPGAKVPACVDTVQNAFTFTASMFQRWQTLTNWTQSDGSGAANYSQQVYPKDREPLIGTLIIKLANGYTSVIPHHELVTHERGNDTQGKYVVVNASRIAAAVNSGQTDLGDNVPVLGGVFLSQNYLSIDYVGNSFWLSPQVGDGTLPDDIKISCKDGGGGTSSGGDNGTPGEGGYSKLGLQIGLPVAFVVVSFGVFAYYMHRRGRTDSVGQTTMPAAGNGGEDRENAVPRHRQVSELPSLNGL